MARRYDLANLRLSKWYEPAPQEIADLSIAIHSNNSMPVPQETSGGHDPDMPKTTNNNTH